MVVNLSDIAKFSSLERIEVEDVGQVSGRLAALAHMSKLLEIRLSRTGSRIEATTEINGTLKDFSELVRLETIVIHATELTGDLAHFGPLRRLKCVELNGVSGVTGDVSVFDGLQDLEGNSTPRARSRLKLHHVISFVSFRGPNLDLFCPSARHPTDV